ncbi:hypothetical protein ABH897_002185 [Paenibacillus sp. RC73]|uniref:hypothetical protein n=1 Tax=Paenibacillus sp. RC73 TaxID=3156250 RepID=UPI0038357CE0
MASEKTPNLGLNQIDRTSPKTTYFDLEKYLDQNWRAVDNFAGDVNDGVDAIKKRLDTTERKEVTLEPGVQIVHAEKASPFSLTGLSGRTLVNLLGRWGNLSSLTGITPYQSEIALDTTNKETMPNSLKVTIKSGYTVGVGFYSDFKFLAGKYYVAIAKVKVGNSVSAGISAPNVQEGTTVTDKTKFTTSWFRAAPTSNVTSNIDLRIQGTQGQYSYFEAVRIYEISATDYTALALMTGEQIDAKYPYVDSVMPVRNPYAIRYGENLLPSFYEWQTTGHKVSINSPYSIEGELLSSAIGTDAYSVISLGVIPNKEYTVTNPAESTGKIRISSYNAAGTRIQGIFIKPGETRVIKMDAAAVRIGVNLSGVIQYTNEFNVDTWTWPVGTKYKFYAPILSIGSTLKPFKPREDSMLALQTELYADPVTGANADTVYERDGQYFKSKKWRSLVLDGTLSWAIGDTSSTGLKQVKVVGLVSGAVTASGWATKFDGKIIPQGTTGSTTDTNAVTGAGDLYISVATADSGWGDSYTPTANEIKAYFMGWRMRNQTTLDPYTSGVKAWGSLVSGGTDYYTNTLPNTVAPDYKTPYQLVYQLATPTVEPITSEGQLSFVEGDNQVEVGTGIVLRERATYADNGAGANVFNAAASAFKFRAEKVLVIYEDGHVLPSAILGQRSPTYVPLLGTGFASITPQETRLDRAYSATYLLFDRSPVVLFTGTYVANEKTLLLDLVDSVQQNTERVSVLENKKAEWDDPAWIQISTTINGWVTAGILPEYRRMGNRVQLRMRVKNGVIGSPVLVLPKDYRPTKYAIIPIHSYTGSADVLATLILDVDGRVIPSAGSNNQINAFVEFNLD